MTDEQMKKKYQILLVEDDDNVRRTTAAFLRENHFHVIEAQDGARALQMLRNQRFNLIICDINLPRMQGDDLVNEVRKMDGHEGIPIIILSGYLNTEVIGNIKGKVQKIMVKPVSMADLVKEIMAVHQKRNSG